MRCRPFTAAAVAALLTLTACSTGRKVVTSENSVRTDTLRALLSEELSVTLHGVEFHPGLAGPLKGAERMEIQRGRVTEVTARSETASAMEAETPRSGGWKHSALPVAAVVILLALAVCVVLPRSRLW